MINITDNQIKVKTLAYRYKFKTDPFSLSILNSALFYPVMKDEIKYYMVGRNTMQQFYLGVDKDNQIWKMIETNHFNEQTELNDYILNFEQVNFPNLGNIGHW